MRGRRRWFFEKAFFKEEPAFRGGTGVVVQVIVPGVDKAQARPSQPARAEAAQAAAAAAQAHEPPKPRVEERRGEERHCGDERELLPDWRRVHFHEPAFAVPLPTFTLATLFCFVFLAEGSNIIER